jgi:predicted nicotinamide N-methyase
MASPSHEELLDFIQAHTELTAPPGCPEVRLHTAQAMTSLWQAGEKMLAGMNVPPPYWALAWAGSQALARHLIENRWLVRGRQVLDFVAGSGIAGIAAAQLGAARVEAFDGDPLARAAVALNAQSNGVSVGILADDPAAADGHAPWEVVLVGDIGYEAAAAQKYMPWLREVAAQGALVLLADPGAVYADAKGTVHLADYEIPTSGDPADRALRVVGICRIAG